MIQEHIVNTIKEIIQNLVQKMGVSADIEIREQPQSLVFNLRVSDDPQMIIGGHGVNLSALQYLCRAIARKKLNEQINFVIDIDDYRKKREQYLSSLVQKAAATALAEGKPVALRPMSAYERRIVHITLADHDNIATQSIGNPPKRLTIICPENIEFPKMDTDEISIQNQDYVIIKK